jgi:hypothetical protein
MDAKSHVNPNAPKVGDYVELCYRNLQVTFRIGEIKDGFAWLAAWNGVDLAPLEHEEGYCEVCPGKITLDGQLQVPLGILRRRSKITKANVWSADLSEMQ